MQPYSKDFQPAWWCPAAHGQTIWAGVLRPVPHVPTIRRRWELPDGDFIDIDILGAPPAAPRLIILHGLESSSGAPAVLGLIQQARSRGWGAVAISAPFDLAASVVSLGKGFSRIYQRNLVAALKQKTLQKLARFPDLVNKQALIKVRTLGEFDDLVTAPVHGFKDAKTYWAASSSTQFLGRIQRPTLLINAEDDPFLPREALPRQAVAGNKYLSAAFTATGGHIGFLTGAIPALPVSWAEEHACGFLERYLGKGNGVLESGPNLTTAL